MKFALALVTLALVAAVNAAPKGTFFSTALPNSGLEQVQIDVRQMGQAAADLVVSEKQLAALSAGAQTVADAKDALKLAVNVDGLTESTDRFPHLST